MSARTVEVHRGYSIDYCDNPNHAGIGLPLSSEHCHIVRENTDFRFNSREAARAKIRSWEAIERLTA
ncbi:hypothetical protein LCGC14_2408030 [marine sediment metagenome]|uniref:Uncharacterized protein n=1 Tax=marine sediment metagenome TaxID=412755 RepID=A0A0F9E5G8_9ZZZZ